MTIAPVLFYDTETTSLDDDRQIWNMGLVLRRPGAPQATLDLIITDVDLTHANEESLAIGHFNDRHPLRGGDPGPGATLVTAAEAAGILHEWTTPAGEGSDARVHVIGCVPDFDTSTSKRLLAEHGYPWQAHYHLIDVENLAIGFLIGSGWFTEHAEEILAHDRLVAEAEREMVPVGAPAGTMDAPAGGSVASPVISKMISEMTGTAPGEYQLMSPDTIERVARLRPVPPYDSDAVSAALGVAPLPEQVRHTALGDAQWAAQMWDVVLRYAPPVLLEHLIG